MSDPHWLGMLRKDVMHFLNVILILYKNVVTSLASRKTDLDANTQRVMSQNSLHHLSQIFSSVDVLDVELSHLSLTLRWGEGTEVAAYAFRRWL